MNPERFHKIRAIFEAAREKSAETRLAFMKAECKDDYTLLAEVERLLAADGKTDSFIDGRPPLKDDGPHPANPPGLEPGTLLCKRYRIIKLIGHGGMGAVYQAFDCELTGEGPKESIALKLILPQYADRKDLVRRFREEILLARHVTHRNVVRIFSLEKDGDLLFITMEFVEGQDLATLLDTRGRYSPLDAARIMYQAACGVEAAHAANVIHRDLKTRNIMLQPDGRAVVTDFGLARPLDNQSRTVTAGIVGTLAYMAPEQLLRQTSDHRADLYSLGVVFYELLTGKLPPKVASRAEKKSDPLSEVFQQKSLNTPSGKVEQALDRIVRKCLEDDPKNRYQLAKDLREDVENWLRPPSRAPRVTRWSIGAAVVSVLASLIIGRSIWWKPSPPVAHPPVTLLIADFVNRTGDSVFSDGTLESVLSIALEGASFINSYSRGAAHKVARQLDGNDGLTEALAREVAVREGVQSVVVGSLDLKDSQYVLNVNVADADSSVPLISRHSVAHTREGVLSSTSEIARDIRRDLGEKIPFRQRAETFTASSLAAIHAYSVAQELTLAGKANDAIAEYKHAILLDPGLGRAYSGLAVLYRNKNQTEEALKYYEQALKHIDRMTDRERYRTRGGYFITSGNPDKAIDEFAPLVKEFPVDNAGWANLALAWSLKRDMAQATEYGRRAVKIYPKNVAQRCNLAWYLMFAGQYREAITEASKALEYNRGYEKAYIVAALSKLAQGSIADAKQSYNDLRQISADGVSAATVGLADIALYEGRMEEAGSLLETGANSDLATRNPQAAAIKLAILAQTNLLMGKPAEALTAATHSEALGSEANGVLFQLAQVFVKLNPKKASEIAEQMAQGSNHEKRSYALLLKGELKLQNKDANGAIAFFEDAVKLADTWIAHYDLGLAYLHDHKYPEADGELEACIRRRGESTSVFIDDTPTYRDFPPVYYFHGLAEDGLGVASSKPWYEKFLAIKIGGGVDPMIDDARKHLNK
jgi:serine/threonine protein kinase/tetratricopeptide (TPR) repeat protein